MLMFAKIIRVKAENSQCEGIFHLWSKIVFMYFHSNRAQNPVHLPFLCKLLFGKAFAWGQSSHNAVIEDFFKRNHKVNTKKMKY